MTARIDIQPPASEAHKVCTVVAGEGASTYTGNTLSHIAGALLFVTATASQGAISITPIEGGVGAGGSITGAYNFPAAQFAITEGTNVNIIAGAGLTNMNFKGWTVHNGAVTNATTTLLDGATIVDNLLTVNSNITSTGFLGATGLVARTQSASAGVTLFVDASTDTYSIQLPATNGLSDQVMRTDGSGALYWSTASSGEVTNLTFDSQFFFDGSHVAIMSGLRATNVQVYQGSANASALRVIPLVGGVGEPFEIRATNGPNVFWTDSNAVVRASNFVMTAQTAWSDANASHAFVVQAAATTTVNQTNSWPATNALAGQSLHSDGAGVWYWATATGAGGSITGAYAFNSGQFGVTDATNVSIASKATVTNLITYGWLLNTNLSTNVGIAYFNSTLALNDDDASASLKLQAAAAMAADVTLTLPATNGLNGQYLTENGSGTLRWASHPADQTNAYNGNQFTVLGGTNVAIKSGVSLSNIFHYGDFFGIGDITNSGHMEIGNANVLGTLWVNANIENTSVGDITGFINMNAVQDVTAGQSLISDGTLVLRDDDATHNVALQAAGVTTTSYTLTLPPTNGLDGQLMINNGAGALSWSTVSAAGNFIGTSAGQGTNTTFRGDVRVWVPVNGIDSFIVGGAQNGSSLGEVIVVGTNIPVTVGPSIWLRRGNGPGNNNAATNGSALGSLNFSGIASGTANPEDAIAASARIKAVAVGTQSTLGSGAYLTLDAGSSGVNGEPKTIVWISDAGLNVTNNAVVQSNFTVGGHSTFTGLQTNLNQLYHYGGTINNWADLASPTYYSLLAKDDAGSAPVLSFQRSRGNLSSWTALNSGDRIGLISFYGFGASGVAGGFAIDAKAIGAFSDTVGETLVTFDVGSSNSAIVRSPVLSLRAWVVTNHTDVRINSNLIVSGSSALLDADGSHRFELRAAATTTVNQTNSWPATNALAGQSLHSDGAGVWYWATATGAGGSITGAYAFNSAQFGVTDATNVSIAAKATVTNLITYGWLLNTNLSTNVGVAYFNSTLALNDDDASASLKLQSAAAMASDVTLTFPATNGLNGQTLLENGSGVLRWANPPALQTNAYNGLQFTVVGGTNVTIKDGVSLTNIFHYGDFIGAGDITNAGAIDVGNANVNGTLWVNANIENTSIGDITGFINMNAVQDVTAGSSLITDGTLVLRDDDASRSVSIQAASVTTSNYTLTLPLTNGLANQVMRTDGTSLHWVTPGATGESNYVGEVSVTNASRFGLVHSKVGVTNLLRSLSSAATSILIQNEGTNLNLVFPPGVTLTNAVVSSVTGQFDQDNIKIALRTGYVADALSVVATNAPTEIFLIRSNAVVWNPMGIETKEVVWFTNTTTFGTPVTIVDMATNSLQIVTLTGNTGIITTNRTARGGVLAKTVRFIASGGDRIVTNNASHRIYGTNSWFTVPSGKAARLSLWMYSTAESGIEADYQIQSN